VGPQKRPWGAASQGFKISPPKRGNPGGEKSGTPPPRLEIKPKGNPRFKKENKKGRPRGQPSLGPQLKREATKPIGQYERDIAN